MPKTIISKKDKVDFSAYKELVHQVKEHRKSRLINVDEFMKVSKKV